MGCCNKVYEERPVSRLRYLAGLGLVCGAHGAFLAWIAARGVAQPRYRKLLRGYSRYSADVVLSVWRRERILIGAPRDQDDCALHVVTEGEDLDESAQGGLPWI
jgi:hypothetical protein